MLPRSSGRTFATHSGSRQVPEQISQPGSDSADVHDRLDTRDLGLLREFWLFLKINKAWWLAPIALVVLLLAMLAVLSGTGPAPFIYPMQN
jgi:uncharacterized protein DUF5989